MQLREEEVQDYFPRLNVGCIFDILSGRWVEGPNGESILTGGLAVFTGSGGPPNHFKSALADWFTETVMERYRDEGEGLPSENGGVYNGTTASKYDTENTFELLRMDDFTRLMPFLRKHGFKRLKAEGLFSFYKRANYFGEDWFDDLKKFMVGKVKNKKAYLTLPFRDVDGTHYKVPPFNVVTCDSLTEFTIENLEKLFDKNEIGDKDLNMEAMKEMAAKAQMIRQLPSRTALSSTYTIWTSHVTDKHVLDPKAIETGGLHYLKGNAKFNRAPKPYSFLTNDLYYLYSMGVKKNQGTKGPEWPTKRGGEYENSPELQWVKMYNTRGKAGLSGEPMTLIFSQKDGLCVGLTELEFLRLKGNNKFGIGGNDTWWFLDLMPDVKLSRTTVRDKLDESHELRRAMHITMEMCYMYRVGFEYDPEILCQPTELYEDLKAKGYDWDILLNTRDWWLPLEWEKNASRPYLSTMDLLKMRKGTYKPKWYDAAVKAKEAATAKESKSAEKKAA